MGCGTSRPRLIDSHFAPDLGLGENAKIGRAHQHAPPAEVVKSSLNAQTTTSTRWRGDGQHIRSLAEVVEFRMGANAHEIEKSPILLDHDDQNNLQGIKAAAVLEHDILNQKNQQGMKAATLLEHDVPNQKNQQDMKAATLLEHDVPNQNNLQGIKAAAVIEHDVPNQNNQQGIKAAAVLEHDVVNQNNQQDITHATLRVHDTLSANKQENMEAATSLYNYNMPLLAEQPQFELPPPNHQIIEVTNLRDHHRALSRNASSNSSVDIEWSSQSTLDIASKELIDATQLSATVLDSENIEQAANIRQLSWCPPSAKLAELSETKFATPPPLVAKRKEKREVPHNARISVRATVARAAPYRSRAPKSRSHRRHRHSRASAIHRFKKKLTKRSTKKRTARTFPIRFGPDNVVRGVLAAAHFRGSSSRRIRKYAMKKRMTYRSERDVVFGQETAQEWRREQDWEPDPSTWFPEGETSHSTGSATSVASHGMSLSQRNASTNLIVNASHDLTLQTFPQKSSNPPRAKVPPKIPTATDSTKEVQQGSIALPTTATNALSIRSLNTTDGPIVTVANAVKALTTSSPAVSSKAETPKSHTKSPSRDIVKRSRAEKKGIAAVDRNPSKESATVTDRRVRVSKKHSMTGTTDSLLPGTTTDKRVHSKMLKNSATATTPLHKTTQNRPVVAAESTHKSANDWPAAPASPKHLKGAATRAALATPSRMNKKGTHASVPAREPPRHAAHKEKTAPSNKTTPKHVLSNQRFENAPMTHPTSEAFRQKNRDATRNPTFRHRKADSKHISTSNFSPRQRIQSSNSLKPFDNRTPKTPALRNPASPGMVIASTRICAPALYNPPNPLCVKQPAVPRPRRIASTKRVPSTSDAVSIQHAWGTNDSHTSSISSPANSQELKFLLTRRLARRPDANERSLDTTWYATRQTLNDGRRDVQDNYASLHAGEVGQVLTGNRTVADKLRPDPRHIVSKAMMMRSTQWQKDEGTQQETWTWNNAGVNQRWSEDDNASKIENFRVIKSLRPSVQRLSI